MADSTNLTGQNAPPIALKLIPRSARSALRTRFQCRPVVWIVFGSFESPPLARPPWRVSDVRLIRRRSASG
jgi:hypothetical protein